MLKITVPPTELYNESKREFIQIKGQELVLEHSLVSVSKWEAKWQKPFIDNRELSVEEFLDYVKCMTITQNVDPNVYLCLTRKNYEMIKDYILSPMTATIINDRRKSKSSRQKVTSELIYYWMFSLGISIECQKWHLNRLLTLIRIFDIENSKQDKHGKMSKKDIYAQNRALNEARRAKYHTKG